MRSWKGIPLLLAAMLALSPVFSAPAYAESEPDTPGMTQAEADWRRERDEALFQLMKRYGDFASDEEIYAAVAGMAIDPDRPMIALTYDDGPKIGSTDRVLDTLEQYNARATFFVKGVLIQNNEACAELARRTVSIGCEIGSHTWKHENLQQMKSSKGIRNTLRKTNEAVWEAAGYDIKLLRPPGGYSSDRVRRIAGEMGMAVALWSQSGNVHSKSADEVVQNVLKQIVNGRELQDRDIVLLHDTQEIVAEATEVLVPLLLSRGYQLVTVSELLHYAEGGFVPGRSYRHG